MIQNWYQLSSDDFQPILDNLGEIVDVSVSSSHTLGKHNTLIFFFTIYEQVKNLIWTNLGLLEAGADTELTLGGGNFQRDFFLALKN